MQFIDLHAQYERIREPLEHAVSEVMTGGRYIMGPQVTDLEERLAAYVGRKHCVSCSNGTDALTMPLMAWGIGPGDAVFVPDFTFFASAEVVAHTGAVPVFCEVNGRTFNLDAASLENRIRQVLEEGKLTPRVVIAVDLFGQPADYPAIEAVAKKYGLKLLEDGAQGFGGTCGGKRTGSFGDASTTSFFPAKPLGCYGDGGAVFTDDDELAVLLRSIRVHGSNPQDKYDNVRIGLNARLDTMQAAVLHCKLDIFDDELITRDRAAARYTRNLAGKIQTPVVPDGFTSSWAQYTVRLPEGTDRAEIMRLCKEQGVPTMVYYPRPMHLQTAFLPLGGRKGDYPVSESCCETVLSCPMHPYLTDENVDHVCEVLLGALAR